MSRLILQLTSSAAIHYAEQKGNFLRGFYTLKKLVAKIAGELLVRENCQPQTRIEADETRGAALSASPEPAVAVPLVEGMRVETPAGLATIRHISYCDRLKQLRCSVRTDAVQQDGSHWAAFDVSQVQLIENGRLL